jgi:hypothetical protein
MSIDLHIGRAAETNRCMRGGILFFLVVLAACGTSSEKANDSDAGASGASECPAPFAECDGNPNTLCETRLDTDPSSCGGCGKACPAGAAHQVATCASNACGVACEHGFSDCDGNPANGCEAVGDACGMSVTDLAVVGAPGGIALDTDFVYYGAKGTPPNFVDGIVYKIPKSGGVPTALATGLNAPVKITLDGERVYWANSGNGATGSIASVAKNGGPVTTIASLMVHPNNPVVVGPRIYWTTREQPAGRLLSARKDGGDAMPTVVVDTIVNPTTLALMGTTLVWGAMGAAADGSDARVERANLDGTARITLALGIPAPAYQFGFGPDALFVGSRADGTIHRIPFDTAIAPTTIASGLGEPQEIIADETTLYVVTGAGKRVVALPSGGGSERLIAQQVYPSYLAADADNLYWLDGPLSGTATLRRAKKSGN